jgi:formate dehydrogenase iron-sulfur subunit
MPKALLYDATLCIGCLECERACAAQNKLPYPESIEKQKKTSEFKYTYVAVKQQPDGEKYMRRLCMHCNEPTCVSACPVGALVKTKNGPVTYDEDKCMGCRYCMVACPFEIPKYQYDRLAPLVRKCTFCANRQAEGKKPACAEACPTGALAFGKRGPLLELAKGRIYRNPEKYVHRVYGEHEAGGTDWLYVSDVPFEQLAMPSVRDEPYPDKVMGALGAPPFVMTLWPPLLMGVYAISKRRDEIARAARGGPAGSEGDGGEHA